jgi:peptidyl-Lys metalloendopeptidase
MRVSFTAALLCSALLSVAAKLEARISAITEGAFVEGGGAFILQYALSNTGASAVTVLTQDTPLEDSIRHPFLKFSGETEAEYTGIVVKRVAKTEVSDYLTLQPGQTVVEDIDLSHFYSFESNGFAELTALSTFYLADAHMSLTPSLDSLHATVSVRSNSLRIYVEGAAAKQRRAQTQDGDIEYLSCSSSRQSSVAISVQNAKTMMNAAVEVLEGDPTTAYVTWFGAVTTSRFDKVRSNMGNILSEFASESYKIDCSCTDDYYAYVYPSDRSHTVYLCNAFWNAPVETFQFDSKPGTLIHELSHFSDVGGTDDHAYGQSAVQSLAINNPALAINNADSHEYFVESDPSDGTVLPPPAPTPPTPPPTARESLDLGELAEEEITLDGNTVEYGDMRFEFSLPAGLQNARLDVTTCSRATDFDTYLWLIDDAGEEVAQNDDMANCAKNEFASRMRLRVDDNNLQAGQTYMLVLAGYSGATGTFRLTLSLQGGSDPAPSSGVPTIYPTIYPTEDDEDEDEVCNALYVVADLLELEDLCASILQLNDEHDCGIGSTEAPTNDPTYYPTVAPTNYPTSFPTVTPTKDPTPPPTEASTSTEPTTPVNIQFKIGGNARFTTIAPLYLTLIGEGGTESERLNLGLVERRTTHNVAVVSQVAAIGPLRAVIFCLDENDGDRTRLSRNHFELEVGGEVYGFTRTSGAWPTLRSGNCQELEVVLAQ